MYGKARPLYLWTLQTLLLICVLLGAAPTLWKMSGTFYLPSHAWAQTTATWAAVSGAAVAVLLVLTLALSWRWRNPALPKSRIVLLVIIGPVIAFLLGQDALLAGGPMMAALVAGRSVKLPYVVESVERFGDRKCRDPIVLKDMPLRFDRLCFYTDAFRKTLPPGTQIGVTGRGTDLGLFPAAIDRSNL